MQCDYFSMHFFCQCSWIFQAIHCYLFFVYRQLWLKTKRCYNILDISLTSECTEWCRQAENIQFFSEVMARLWLVVAIYLGSARFPPLDEGISYTQVSAGEDHTVLLRSDGQAVACGRPNGQCEIPPLDEGISYVQVSAGTEHTVLLRSDGQAVACGDNYHRQCEIPSLDEGISYVQVSASREHTVLFRSDGQAVACANFHRQCKIPPLDERISYVQVSTGGGHTVLLRSDGQAVACGDDVHRQCEIPPLDEGISYVQVSAGRLHTVLLRSDGQAVACGRPNGQCEIPPLDEGISYVQVSAGREHTVLLRSDGQAVACGCNYRGQCEIPPLESGHCYVSLVTRQVLQLEFACEGDAVIVSCLGLDGHEVLRLKARKSDRAADICGRVARELNTSSKSLRLFDMVLPNGQLFASSSRADPLTKLSDVIWIRNVKRVRLCQSKMFETKVRICILYCRSFMESWY